MNWPKLWWLMPRKLRIRAYREIMRQHRNRAVRAANARDLALFEEAKLECGELLEQARRGAGAISEKAEKYGYQKGMDAADAECQRLYMAASAQGHREGKEAAFYVMGEQLGLTNEMLRDRIDAAMVQTDQIDLDANYANIYYSEPTDRWIVRVLKNGEMFRREFPICDGTTRRPAREERLTALLAAVRFRNALSDGHSHAALVEECRQAAVRELHTDPGRAYNVETALARTCELYHLQMLSRVDVEVNTRHVGDDPEDRFQLSDTSIMTLPWMFLYDWKPGRQRLSTFSTVGLNDRRTVRDLLMVTAQELKDAGRFGKVAMDDLRRRLAAYKLALWGEELPAFDVETRQLRSINLNKTEGNNGQ